VAGIVGGISVDSDPFGAYVLAMLQKPPKRGGPERFIGLIVGVIL
jgi:hypothetical protein